jgi:RHS repeat-associated protein
MFGNDDNAKKPETPAGSQASGQPESLARGAAPEAATNGDGAAPFAVTAPTLTLPKGGGAIRGIAEKFTANPVTGTASFTVPIATSPGRSGFGPKLALSYDSGNANSAYGFGWTLDTPHIARKTNKGGPRYIDTTDDTTESDVFILSGAEDLVPVLDADGHRVADTKTHPGYVINRYRPRIEGLFARIERWTRLADGDTHWRSISRDNILTIYGGDADSRIADPADPRRVFSWLISETRDDRGNGIVYGYKPDNGDGIDLACAHQGNRGSTSDARRATNRYLKRIRYGNRTPLLDQNGTRPTTLDAETVQAAGWMFELVLDYGEHDPDTPTPAETRPWPARGDSLSTYRPGFEVRTTRLCRRFLMFHHFPDEPEVGADCLVRSTDLTYADGTAGYAFLQSVTHSGYRRAAGGHLKRSLPPVEYTYSELVIDSRVHELAPTDLENLPIGVDGDQYQLVDLHGEGLAGILTRQADAWWYRRNVSPLSARDVEFAPLERVPVTPHATAGARFMDLGGDGRLDLVDFNDPSPGYYAHDDEEGWNPYRPLHSRINRQIGGPGTRFIDLDGDGLADLMITEDNAITWHQSLGLDGFGPATNVPLAFDEEQGPTRAFINDTEAIHVADISGDGLSDIVRIRNGEICYWPNLGYGRFGPKVVMDNAPRFDDTTSFDPTHLLLADIDATGTTDLIYLHRDGIRVWFNQSGNGWSTQTQLPGFPSVDRQTAFTTTDLRGNGTACLLWSSPHPGDTGRHMRYIDLMGGTKPHLLIASANNLGAETHVSYASSTKFYLQDKHAGTPWITRLVFPVHVVESVETWDWISRNRFVTRYAYHHGYFDPVEREFRGFGMVEQWDTEEFGSFNPGGSNPLAQNQSAQSYVPPVHTKTWFHTGIYVGREHISDFYAGLLKDGNPGEYYREPGLNDTQAAALLLADTALPTGLTFDEEREACRALKGMMLRQETYADDARPGATPEQLQRAATPYTVTEQNFAIRTIQTTGSNQHSVFFAQPLESLTYHYERSPADPRVQHGISLDIDEYGNVLKDIAIGYGRRHPDRRLPTGTDRAKQTTPLIIYTEHNLTDPIDGTNPDGTLKYPDDYRTPLPADTRTYELTGFAPDHMTHRFRQSDFVTQRAGTILLVETGDVEYEQTAPAGRQRRIIEHTRTLYRPDDLGAAAGSALTLLPLGTIEPAAIAGQRYKLALTPGLLGEVYARNGRPLIPDPTQVLTGAGPDRGGYQSSTDLRNSGVFPHSEPDGYWWMPSGRTFLSPHSDDAVPASELTCAHAHFYLAQRVRTPFHTSSIPTETMIAYDRYDLLIRETTNSLGNRVTAGERRPDGSIDTTKPGIDYRVLQPALLTDPNRNRTQVAFDALGMVAGTAMMGKSDPAPVEGDSLAGFDADPPQTQTDAIFGLIDPYVTARGLLGDATTRTVYDVFRFRRTQQANLDPKNADRWLPGGVATLSRETHASDPLPSHGLKIHISFSYSDGFGRDIQKKIAAEPGPVNESGLTVDPRWVASGWTVFNNKGKPVRQYEPFFTPTHTFEFGNTVGVSPILFYDPAERVVAVLHPNHTYDKFVFEPWQQSTYDTNDTSAPRGAQTGDPRTDPDIAGIVGPYFTMLTNNSQWETWYAQRIAGTLGTDERTTATRASAHADTPARAYFDTLGRPFLTASQNRVTCPGHPLDGTDATLYMRVDLDIEGNRRRVRDASTQAGDPLGRIVTISTYDMLGNHIHQQSMDASATWTLNDIAGKLIRAWDSRGHNETTCYDALRRVIARTVRGTTTDSDPRTLNREIQVDRIEYGETQPNAETLNLRTRVYRHFDSGGLAINACLDAKGDPVEAFDFKGNLLHSARQLAVDHTAIPDWSTSSEVAAEIFESTTRFDALNRVTQVIAPHSSLPSTKLNVIQPGYNERGLLRQIDVWLGRNNEPTTVLNPTTEAASLAGVSSLDYDAKGQRLRIAYKNGASTRYEYDPSTFRLMHQYTWRGQAFTHDCDNSQPPPATTAAPDNPPTDVSCGLQNLHYTHDPVGNITHISDEAQQTIYFRNKRVNPGADYIYDAAYRLIQATGREHLGQTGGQLNPPTAPDAFNTFHTGLNQPGDGNAMGTYTETYVYDGAGNCASTKHASTDPAQPGWTLAYTYNETSFIENGRGATLLKTSNRLTQTALTPEGIAPSRYLYDADGNTTYMPHLGDGSLAPNMYWDYNNQLRGVDRGGGGVAYFVYDSSGQRIRKVWEKSPGRTEERIYLGGYEIFRIYPGRIAATTVTLERETLHLMDNQRRIAMVETRTFDTSGNDPAPQQLVRYRHDNHLGSATLELDDQAQIISYEEYAPYGNTTYQALRNQAERSKRYRYTGKERDEESGLSYHGARYYAPWLGRWISPDPAGLIDGFNLFEYARGNPLRFSDPSGTQSKPRPDDPRLLALERRSRALAHAHRLHSNNPEAKFQSFSVSGTKGGTGSHAPPLPGGGASGVDAGQLGRPSSPGGSPTGDPDGSAPNPQTGSVTGDPGGGTSDGSGERRLGAARTEGEGGTGGTGTHRMSELDAAVMLWNAASTVMGGSPLPESTSTQSTSGGIPEGRGTHASELGQLAYIAVNAFFTFFSGTIEGGLRKAVSAIKSGVTKAANAAAEFFVGSAFAFLGAGGIGAGSSKAGQLLLRGARSATTLNFTRAFSAADKKAIEAARKSFYEMKEIASVAGTAGHEAAGAAGPGGGVDFIRHGVAFQEELKLHFVPILDDLVLGTASKQSLKYALEYQAKNAGSAVIRSVKHIWVSPTDAVMLITH